MKYSIPFVLIMMFVILVSGCIQTGEIIREPQDNETAPHREVSDPCEGIICGDSFRTCPDGFNVTCNNTCTNGSCTTCMPDCSGHDPIHIDFCGGVSCPDSSMACPDGVVASCKNTCNPDTGSCTACTPDCTGHELEECEGVVCEDSALLCPDGFNVTCNNTCTNGSCTACTPDCTGHELEECEEDWLCTEWSECIEGQQTRACTDQNACGTEDNRPEETQTCEVIKGAIFDILVNEVMPNPAEGPEWLELYNPTPQSVDLNGSWIDDEVGGGRPPQQIEGVTIPANGIVAIEITKYPTSYFNNGGDDVNFGIGGTVIDSYTYGETAKDASWYRLPDGGEWQETPAEDPTKGQPN
jgi:hypothetical protein